MTRMVPLGEIAGFLVGLLVIAFGCWLIVTKVRMKRAKLNRHGEANAQRMGNYVEPCEPVIHLPEKKPES